MIATRAARDEHTRGGPRRGLDRVRTRWVSILQTARPRVSRRSALVQPRPYFAPIAAVIALSAAAGPAPAPRDRAVLRRRAQDLVADLLLSLVPRSGLTLSLLVALTMVGRAPVRRRPDPRQPGGGQRRAAGHARDAARHVELHPLLLRPDRRRRRPACSGRSSCAATRCARSAWSAEHVLDKLADVLDRIADALERGDPDEAGTALGAPLRRRRARDASRTPSPPPRSPCG